MSFLELIINLFSQPPGSLVYHFFILFAIEAALGFALGYRRRPAVRRVVLAMGGILVGRLALMVIALLASQGLIGAPDAIWPPLERAVDAIGVWLLIWALLPFFDNVPQWGNVLAAGGVFMLLVLYLFFALAWYGEAAGDAAAAYSGSFQDTVWTLIQLVLLGAAGVYSLFGRGREWSLRFFIFVVPFAANLVHYVMGSPEGNVAAWVRLGQLIGYPLVMLIAYRLVFGQLLRDAARPPVSPPGDPEGTLRHLGVLVGAEDETTLLETLVSAVASATEAGTVALLSFETGDRTKASVDPVCRDGQIDPDMQFDITLHDAPVLRRALRNHESAFLQPGDKDDPSRLFLLMHLLPDTSLKNRLRSAILIRPICQQDEVYGMLLVQPEPGVDDWPAGRRQLVDQLVAQAETALARIQEQGRLRDRVDQLEEIAGAAYRLGDLKADLDRAREAEQEMAHRADTLRRELAQVKRDARKLTPLIKLSEQQRLQIAQLQQELASMAEREPEREEVPATQDLPAWADAEQVGLVAQELRRPLTSISGYTDVLLGESVGTVGELQRLFLQRVKASTERARLLLDDLVRITASEEPSLFHQQPVQLSEVVEEAVQRLSDQIEIKGLNLQINLEDSLPQLDLDKVSIEQILFNLLSNAVQATPADGQVAVDVRYQENGGMGADEDVLAGSGYLFISVQDSGSGVQISDLSSVFDRHYRSTYPSIDGLGETDLGLPLVRDLLQAQGGRVWIESEPDQGSTLSMVLPAAVVRP
jgi:signal transduction histidine kinase